MHAGRQGVHSGAKLHLLPLPVRGLQHVRPPRPLPGVGGSRAGRHLAVRPGGRPWAGPLQRAALGPADRDPPPGDPHPGSGHAGGRGGDERAGAQHPAGPLPHQGHPVRLPVRVLGFVCVWCYFDPVTLRFCAGSGSKPQVPIYYINCKYLLLLIKF